MLDKPNIKQKLMTDEGLNRQTTFANNDEPFQRRSTFSRAFTFDGAAFSKQISQPLEGLSRTMTELGHKIDPDAKFTKSVIHEYSRVAEAGNDGDIPFPPGFARSIYYWKLIFFVVLVASFMGVAAAAFLNFGDEIPKQWDNCDYVNDLSCVGWYEGQKYWIAITTGAGFCVGVIRWTFSYPDNLPGIFKEIQTYHVDPKWMGVTYCISALSLAGGATLGPEQALGNLGGGIAYFIQQYVDFGDPDYSKIFVLAGMAGPLGALFPSPILGALMIHELGQPPKGFMESTIVLSISAVIGFTVYYEMIGVTYLDYISQSGIKLAIEWEQLGFKDWQIFTGFAIGIISSFLCLAVLLTSGVCKQVFFRIRQRLEQRNLIFLREVLPPTIGGLIIGVVNWALPLTVGNGGMIFNFLIEEASNGAVSQNLLLCTGFARMFLLGVSMNCGFCGGIIFPFLTMGMIAGTIMYLNYSYVPRGLCLAAFMIAVPCGVVPMPFSFTCLALFMFYFGTYQTVPIFVASFTSYLIICGSGLMERLAKNAQKNNQSSQQGDAPLGAPSDASTTETERQQKEAEEFALKQYLGGNKKRVNV